MPIFDFEATQESDKKIVNDNFIGIHSEYFYFIVNDVAIPESNWHFTISVAPEDFEKAWNTLMADKRFQQELLKLNQIRVDRVKKLRSLPPQYQNEVPHDARIFFHVPKYIRQENLREEDNIRACTKHYIGYAELAKVIAEIFISNNIRPAEPKPASDNRVRLNDYITANNTCLIRPHNFNKDPDHYFKSYEQLTNGLNRLEGFNKDPIAYNPFYAACVGRKPIPILYDKIRVGCDNLIQEPTPLEIYSYNCYFGVNKPEVYNRIAHFTGQAKPLVERDSISISEDSRAGGQTRTLVSVVVTSPHSAPLVPDRVLTLPTVSAAAPEPNPNQTKAKLIARLRAKTRESCWNIFMCWRCHNAKKLAL